MTKKSTIHSWSDDKLFLQVFGSRRLFFFVAFLSILFAPTIRHAQAQQGVKQPAEPVICPAKFEDQFSRVNIPKGLEGNYRLSLKQVATAEFEVTFGPGAQANPDARAAFEFALDIWATQVVSPVPIKVFADFANLGPGVLASAGPAYNVRDFAGAPEPGVFYPAALANALAGQVLFPEEEFDFIVNLGNGIPWYFGLDGNTPAGLFDFVTVALHEACHGLGFILSRSFNNGIGGLRPSGFPSIFSLFMVDGEGNSLIDFPDPSVQLGDAFTGGDLFADGTFTKAALGGQRPELFAPSTFIGGSSIAHWDEDAFPAGDPNSLMTPQIGSAESNFDIGDITRGFFKDMGWVVNEEVAPPLRASPASLSVELFVGDTLTQSFGLFNISDNAVNATISTNPGNSTIAFIDPTELSLAGTEIDSFRVILSAIDLAKGFYNDTIFVEALGASQALNIPIAVRVLDGTEVPIISVSPSSFDETLQQFDVETRPLTISNSGDADLVFNITIDDSLASFSNRVKASELAILEKGFRNKAYPVNTESSSLGGLVRGDSDTYPEMVTSLYATDFEAFTPGDVVGQLGWDSQFANNWVIASDNPVDGSQHLRGISDGLGDTRQGFILALSPSITPLDEPFMVMSADVNLTGSGVTWEVITQSNSEEQVNTRLRFNPDGTIDALINPGGFVPVNATIPPGYFNVKIIVDKDDASFRIFFDDELIFSGQGFARNIEQAVFLSEMEIAGPTFDIDNLEITDGDPDAFFLTASPNSGIIPSGTSETVDVKFDARIIDPGSYTASLTVNSNDTVNSPVVIPVSLTVVTPPTISVEPDSLSAAVDVQIDIPPVQTATFTISNSGDNPLEFETSLGPINFSPSMAAARIPVASLNMSNYGAGNMEKPKEKLAGATRKFEYSAISVKSPGPQINTVTFNDSIFYDTGIPFPNNFSGVQTAPYTAAIKFDAESDFTLTAVRNGYRTEAVVDPVIILEVYRGGDTPNDGELLLQQTLTQASEEGILVAEILDEALSFTAGESFWVVHKYPEGVEFPQGVDDNATQRPNTYFFSSDGGTTYSPSGFVFLTRALSGDIEENYITLEPAAGSVEPGGSVEVEVTFNGESLANGTYDRDILIASNDPLTPTVSVATDFTVSGQVSAIAVSDEFLLFNSVFLGAEAQRSFTISNEGLGQLEVSSISSDSPDFTVNPSNAILNAGESVEVMVNFAPSSLGSINGIISIESDASSAPLIEVVVNGVGTEPPLVRLSPELVRETTDAGTVLESSISLVNDGNSPLIFSFPGLAAAAALAKPGVQLNNTKKIDFGDREMSLEKGMEDTRVGTPVLYSLGTDNGFGYSWIDSDEPGGPVYNFVDITASGTEITSMLGADGTMQVTLTFPFEFYGETYNNLFINANGYVSFNPIPPVSWVNTQIPDDGTINNIIAGFWDDIEPQNFNGSVHYEDFGDQFIIQWTTVSRLLGSADETITFQIVLYDDGDIDIFYDDVETASILNSATVGIENADGTDGAQVAFNTAYVKNGLALRFVKPAVGLTPFITQVSPLAGVVPAGGSRDLSVTLDATGLNDGVFFDDLTVSSNAPTDTSSSALFELTVIGFPEIAVTPDSLNFDSLFVGLSTSASLLIENVGSKVLEIAGISNMNTDFELDTLAPITLQPDESLLLGVRFTPTNFGLIEDVLTLSSNDAFGNESTLVYLSGIGVDPPVINVSPDSISVVLFEGDSTVETVSITNEGNFPLSYSLSPPFFAQTGARAVAQQYPVLDLPKIRSKEAPDTRVGTPFLNASGGPGTFGYTWVDNNSGGPAYDFIDISATGQVANVGADGDEQVPLPFTFNFFGIDQDSVIIGANGFLAFAELVGANFVNDPIPNTDNPNFLIAAMWDDLEPQDGDGVFYQGTSDYFIVQYENVPGFFFPPPTPAPVTFQVILFPDGSIKMQYENVNSTIRTSSTVGLEGPMGMSGLQVIFNTEFLTDELAITFRPPVLGTLAPGETADVPLTISSDGIEGGATAMGDIRVSSNDPITPVVNVPVTVEVLELPEIVSFTLINAELNEEIGPLLEGDVIDLDNYPSNSFSVVAIPDSIAVGSVVFDFNEVDRFQIENRIPYALDGDSGGPPRYDPVEFPLGLNTITATPYTERGGNGKEGIGLTVNFEVIGSAIDDCFGREVLSYLPGNRKNGLPLPASRSNPMRALGAPGENDSYNFVALGFGGSIEIAMECEVMDKPGNDVLIVETSFRDINQPCESYPEKARVEASGDGVNWVVIADEICKDGEVDLADGGLESARYFRISDISDPNDFRGSNSDGYDLDAIVVINTILDTAGQQELVKALTDEVNVVANEEDIEIRAFPNPAEDQINFSFKGEDGQVTAIIHDMRGEIIHRSTLQITNGEESGLISLGQHRPGLYYMQVINESGGIVSQLKFFKR